MGKLLISKDELYKLYWVDGLSIRKIAEIYGVNDETVRERMIKYGIPRRTRVDGVRLTKRKISEERMKGKIIDEELIEIIDGIVLGDGCIKKPNDGRNGYLSICQRYDRVEFLEYIGKLLSRKGINFTIREQKRNCGLRMIKDSITYSRRKYELESESLIFFTGQRERWYPDGVKRIPKDVRLTPLSLTITYMGDGSLTFNKRNGQWLLRLNLNNFEKYELEWLADRLHELYGWSVGVHRANAGYVIDMCRRADVYDFLQMTKKYAVECFRYKWRALEDEKWVSKIV